MLKHIAVIDSSSGERTVRTGDTATLDVPPDLSRPGGVVSVDAKSKGHYVKSGGGGVDFLAFVRPLSWRARGEECLVATGPKGTPAGYRLSVVEKLPQ